MAQRLRALADLAEDSSIHTEHLATVWASTHTHVVHIHALKHTYTYYISY